MCTCIGRKERVIKKLAEQWIKSCPVDWRQHGHFLSPHASPKRHRFPPSTVFLYPSLFSILHKSQYHRSIFYNLSSLSSPFLNSFQLFCFIFLSFFILYWARTHRLQHLACIVACAFFLAKYIPIVIDSSEVVS